MGKYLIENREEYRLINQTGVRQYVYPLDFSHNAIWDSAVSPDGKLFYGLASEIFTSNYVRLCEYDYDTHSVREHFRAEDVILPQDRAIRASKFHTSIHFIDRDHMIMTTHTTDKSPAHPTWMPYGYYHHLWEGFAGSHILTYDRATGKAENLGVPALHESIYGSCYDPDHRALFSMGFFKGHLYRYDLDTRRAVDLGKASEGFSFRLARASDGNLYGATRSGWVFRVDTRTCRIEDLNYRFHHYSATYPRQFTNISVGRTGPDGRLYMAVMYDHRIYALDPASGKIEPIGNHLPGGRVDYIRGENRCGIFGMDFDSKGNLWYAMTSKSDETGAPEYGLPAGLFRWNVFTEREPEFVGMIGTPERVGAWLSEVGISGDDILYAVGSNHSLDGPDITAIDLKAFTPVCSQKSDMPIRDGFYDPACERYVKSSALLHSLEKVGEENEMAFPGPVEGEPIRLWRALAPDRTEDSCVQGLAWDDEGALQGLCGRDAQYAFCIADGKLERLEPISELDGERAAWLHAATAKTTGGLEAVALPFRPGRQYLAKSYVAARMDGCVAVVTADAMLAIVRGEKVFSLGPVSEHGPCGGLAVTQNGKTLYGVSGDREDLGNIFRYDAERGLTWLGTVNHELPGLGDTANLNALSACAVSRDGRFLAVGSGDRLGTVVIFRLPEA